MDNLNYLLAKLKEAVSGKLSYSDFEKQFYSYYIDEVSDEDLNSDDQNFFTKIQEKFEYTVIDPPQEDRVQNYVSYEEFLSWLKGEIRQYTRRKHDKG